MLIALTRVIEKNQRNNTFIPFNLAYLVSYLEKYGNYTDFIIEDDIDVLISKKPDIVGISSYTQNIEEAILYSKKIKNSLNIPIILGGAYITYLPESLNKIFDAGVIGEGEQTFLELVNLIKNNSFDKESLSKVDGIVYHDGNKNIVTKSRELIKNIDDIPIPKLELLDKYISQGSFYSIHTTRGCPYKCIFCSSGCSTKKARFHSPQRIIEELSNISKRNTHIHTSYIYITDDLFPVNLERLKEIVKAIKENGFDKEFKFICNARADVFTREIAKLLKDMNVLYVSFGFESGSDKVLKYLKSYSCSVKKHYEVLDICKEYNLGVGSYFIIGSPIETLEDLAKTYWFISNNNRHINLVSISKLIALPGSTLWEEFIKSNNFTKEEIASFNWENIEKNVDEEDLFFLGKEINKEVFFKYAKQFKNLEISLNNKNSSKFQTKGFLGKVLIGQLEGQFFYQDSMYQILKDFIPKDVKKILEINQHSFELERYVKNIEISSIKANQLLNKTDENKENKKEYFDLAFFDHSLEETINYENYFDEISKLVKSDGYFLFIIYNILFIENIIDLIYNNFNFKNYGIRQYNNYNYFSLKTFEEFANKKGLKIQSYIKYKMNTNKYEDNIIKKIIDVFKSYKIDENLEYFNYIFLCKK